MNAKRLVAYAAVAAAVVAGGYVCAIGAHDHTRPGPAVPVAAAAVERADVLAARGEDVPAYGGCALGADGGLYCSEEIVVVGRRPALASVAEP